MTDDEYMGMALNEAEKAYREGEVPIGAVLVYDDAVIAADHNRREQLADPTAHAEVLVIREGAGFLGHWRLTGCSLYVTIEPCFMCAGAIMNARVSRLVYGSDDPDNGGLTSGRSLFKGVVLNHKISVSSGIRERECKKILDDFFASHRT